ncbi:class I glutamine amidotransferase-like protein [Trematosphaeria pertusa]|uniref:Class I glutamine amidotransferase-like protein n=1 Tax=Trematosphaeria pertusa TaxID=390896 RepID=A0A6A6IF98_9PLEO|nr:class I glutamine amidotransferase-like protein [Trematosphaeria pertusa]KAF2249086.1 class I glutamine amidotransferase-like protein [Trematosphaeria pertusa]
MLQVMFPGFEPLDVFGPLEILFWMSYYYNITLSVVSFVKGPVNARPPSHNMRPGMPQGHTDIMLGPTTVATHTFADAPDLDLIIVPGGMGNVALEEANNTEMEAFLAARAPHASYILSVCTGSVTLARAGLLSGKRATTNKASWAWVTDPVVIWTSSGVAAGMDMMYAFMKHLYGTDNLDQVMNLIEYAPHLDPHWDPFSVVHKVPGADMNASLADCVVPVSNEADMRHGR